jgi:hypothetical protein
MGDAAAFLGYETTEGGRVSSVANPKDHHTQTQSKKTGEWFQAKKAYDETPFEKNMPTPDEKLRKKTWVFNMTTGEESWFPGTDLAAVELGILRGKIQAVLDEKSTHFNVLTGEFAGMYDAQRDPKTREWKTDVLSQGEANGLAHNIAVVAYDENDKEVCRYDSATKAGNAEKIDETSISGCARHVRHTAGKKDGSKLRWECRDPELRAYWDHERPRKKPFYYVDNGATVAFKTREEAAKKTHGKTFAIRTQKNAIYASIKSEGKIPCKAGYFWYKLP